MAFTHYRTRGIFLNEQTRREADLFFNVFTERFGKVRVCGKGIRKIQSKLRPFAQVFYLSDIEFIQGRYYKILTDAVLFNKFKAISESSEAMDIAFKICNTLDALTGLEQKDEKIWRLLSKTFQEFNNYKLQTKNYKLFYFFFFWNLVSLLGYQPRFTKENNPLRIIAKGGSKQLPQLEKRTNAYFQHLKNL